jgi:O-antigen ligase
LRTKRKIAGIFGIAVLAAIIVPVLPDAFWDRMRTIQTGAEATDESQMDTSQAGRLHFWRVAIVMGNDRPIIGIGLDAFNYMYDYYDFRNGAFGTKRSVHSSWFGLLAEVGYVGLAIFVVLISRAFYFTWAGARRTVRPRPTCGLQHRARSRPHRVPVGGSFIPHQYNEMLWHFIALSFVFERLVRERLAVPAAVPAEAKPAARPGMWPTQPAVVSGRRGTMRDRR